MNYRIERRRSAGAKAQVVAVFELTLDELEGIANALGPGDVHELDLRAAALDVLKAEREARR